jgi:hypothetical protein
VGHPPPDPRRVVVRRPPNAHRRQPRDRRSPSLVTP